MEMIRQADEAVTVADPSRKKEPCQSALLAEGAAPQSVPSQPDLTQHSTFDPAAAGSSSGWGLRP